MSLFSFKMTRTHIEEIVKRLETGIAKAVEETANRIKTQVETTNNRMDDLESKLRRMQIRMDLFLKDKI